MVSVRQHQMAPVRWHQMASVRWLQMASVWRHRMDSVHQLLQSSSDGFRGLIMVLKFFHSSGESSRGLTMTRSSAMASEV